MKTLGIATFHLYSPLERPFGWSQGWIDHRSVNLVKVSTDEGIVGWGEGAGAEVIDGMLAPALIGQDPTNRIGLWQRMFHVLYNGNIAVGLGGSAISAVDTALWDITGRALGQPIYNLLGGKVRDRVAVYATGLYYTEGEFPTRLLDEARGYVEAGFMGMKTKVGGLPMDEDVKRVAALREAIGPDVKLMVDANQAYNATSAIRMGRRLEEYDILWFEEPVNAQDVEGYLQVKSALPMAIAGGENLRTRYEFSQFLARRAYDIASAGRGQRRWRDRNAQRRDDREHSRNPGQPARLGIAGHDRRQPPRRGHAASVSAVRDAGTVRAGASDGIRPDAVRDPREPHGESVRPGGRLPGSARRPGPGNRDRRRRGQAAGGVGGTQECNLLRRRDSVPACSHAVF